MAEPTNSNFQYGQDANGPQAGGHMPTQAAMLQQSLRDNVARDTRSFWLQQDQRAQFMAAVTLNTTHGNQALAAYNSPQGKALRQGFGTMVNSPMMAGLTGGNILDMYNGANTGMLNSGLVHASINGAGAYQFGGTGFMQDQVAKQLTSSMQQTFFTKTGGDRLGMTSGMDRTQLGQIAAYTGMRGGFAGMGSVGNVKEFGNKEQIQEEIKRVEALGGDSNKMYLQELESLASMDGPGGGVAFKLDDNLSKKVNAKIKEGARALASVQDILGNRGIGELADTAERLTGMNIASVEGSRVITERFTRAKTYADANGLNAEAVISEQMQIGASLRANGLSQKAAGVLSEGIQQSSRSAFRSNQAARNILGDQGIYVPETSLAMTKQVNAMDITEMLKSDSRAAITALDVQSNTLMSEDDKARILGELSKVGVGLEGDTKSQRQASLTQRYKMIEKMRMEAGGLSDASMMSKYGSGANIINSVEEGAAAAAMGSAALSTAHSKLINNNLRQAVADDRLGTRLVDAGMLSDAESMQGIARSMMEFDPNVSVGRMMRGLQGDSPALAFQKILKESSVPEETKAALKQQLTSVVGVTQDADGNLKFEGEGAANALEAIQGFAALRASDPMLNVYNGPETADMQARSRITARMQALAGSQNVGTGGFVDAIAQGVFDGSDISTEMAMEHARLTGDKHGFISLGATDERGFMENLSDEQMKSVAGMAGMSEKDLKDKLKTDTGKESILNALKASGSHISVSNTGEAFLAGADNEALATSMTKLTTAHETRSTMLREAEAEKNVERKAALDKKAAELVPGAYKALIQGKSGWGNGNTEDLHELRSMSAGVRNSMIDSRINEAVQDNDKEKVKGLMALKEQLNADTSEVSLLTQIRDTLTRMEEEDK